MSDSSSTPVSIPENVAPLEAETDQDHGDDDDANSSLGLSIASSSASLTSSIMRYREENGRTYHAFREGRYVLPNDQAENDRLDLQHHIFFYTFDRRLYTCPAGRSRPIMSVIDLGCGTGIWSIDFADDHPESQVIGVDLSPIQPEFVPPNVSFYIDDIEDEWTFSNKFDFVYGRMLTASIADWPKLMAQSYENLNPGGWLELTDILLEFKTDDNTIPPDCTAAKWGEYMIEAADRLGRPLDSAKFYKQQMLNAGFVNVVETIYKWPSNAWPRDQKFKELGIWTYENLGLGASGLSMALFTRVLGWTAEQVELFLVDVRKDMRDRTIHGYWPIYVVYGQKPKQTTSAV